MIHICNQKMRVLGVSGLLLVAFTTLSCSRGGNERGQVRAAADSTRPIAVQVVPATQQDIRRTVEVVGSLTADDEVVISSEVDGRVADVHVGMGDRVEKGEVLVEVERPDAGAVEPFPSAHLANPVIPPAVPVSDRDCCQLWSGSKRTATLSG